ncbi:piggyBac transposable element-derived protein 4 [Trichonephila clavata]|uniref:PiggyBac transposable element-derived protein 4 n=1 Tax=Trichonephila clavata TaxID=2740835 RepID=A0A8X6FD81_TRICU|nr:piggyBac transposable element-derived protein 4 [Trichonephila clavata]
MNDIQIKREEAITNECSSESTDSGDDDIGNARDWCEITASGRSGPPRFPFTGTPGVTFPVNINYTPLDILEMFLDSNLMDIIVKETNNYAEQERKANRAKISRCSRSKKWIPSNDREMKLFFGLIILQGIVRKPNQAIFWSHRRILHTPVYSKKQEEFSLDLKSNESQSSEQKDALIETLSFKLPLQIN